MKISLKHLMYCALPMHLVSAAAEPERDTGKQLYDRVCSACHSPANVMVSAPKAGDREAWRQRFAVGLVQLTRNAVNGINAMPPRGGCEDCSEAQI